MNKKESKKNKVTINDNEKEKNEKKKLLANNK